jgi:23S rRNA pseudouridine1911/1915/1917 synthase
MHVSSKVPVAFHGKGLLYYLTTRYSYLPAAVWQQLLQDGKISCQGGVVRDEAMVVAKNDLIGTELPDFDPPAVNLDYTIVYEDEWLLGINKPAGLRVHSNGKFATANLIYHLRHVHHPAYPEANLVNRLDTDTSGLVLLAKEKTILGPLMRQFADGVVDKRYLAVVAGSPDPACGTIDLPIGPIKHARVPRFGIDRAQGKAAVTHYKTIRPLGNDFTLLELHPETGRTHQLRVHLAAIGHPITGDALYSMNDGDYLSHCRTPHPPMLLQRQALHSLQLQFLHPVLQTVCRLTAPLAADIEQFIQQCNKNK